MLILVTHIPLEKEPVKVLIDSKRIAQARPVKKDAGELTVIDFHDTDYSMWVSETPAEIQAMAQVTED